MWVPQSFSELSDPSRCQSDLFFRHAGFLHSSMYSPLVTNLPFPSLSFVDFPLAPPSRSHSDLSRTPWPDQNSSEKDTDTGTETGESPRVRPCHSPPSGPPAPSYSADYLSQKEYLSYIQKYAGEFGLSRFIQLEAYVKSVRHLQALTRE